MTTTSAVAPPRATRPLPSGSMIAATEIRANA